MGKEGQCLEYKGHYDAAYERADMYRRILGDLICKKHLHQYFCGPGEPDNREEAMDIINKVLHRLTLFKREWLLIDKALWYEMEKGQEAGDKAPDKALWYLFQGSRTLKRSINGTIRFWGILKTRFQNMEDRYGKQGMVTKALKFKAKTMIERCERLEKDIAREYIFGSILRPWYFKLQKDGIVMVDDIAEHIPMDGSYEENAEFYSIYLQRAVSYAEEKGNDNYKEYRRQLYAEYLARNATGTDKEQERARQNRERLEKAAQKIEVSIAAARRPRKSDGAPRETVLSHRILAHPKWSPNAEARGILVLKKVPGGSGGRTQVMYRIPDGYGTKQKEMDIFLTEADLASAMDDCRKDPDVLDVESIQLQ